MGVAFPVTNDKDFIMPFRRQALSSKSGKRDGKMEESTYFNVNGTKYSSEIYSGKCSESRESE